MALLSISRSLCPGLLQVGCTRLVLHGAAGVAAAAASKQLARGVATAAVNTTRSSVTPSSSPPYTKQLQDVRAYSSVALLEPATDYSWYASTSSRLQPRHQKAVKEMKKLYKQKLVMLARFGVTGFPKEVTDKYFWLADYIIQQFGVTLELGSEARNLSGTTADKLDGVSWIKGLEMVAPTDGKAHRCSVQGCHNTASVGGHVLANLVGDPGRQVDPPRDFCVPVIVPLCRSCNAKRSVDVFKLRPDTSSMVLKPHPCWQLLKALLPNSTVMPAAAGATGRGGGGVVAGAAAAVADDATAGSDQEALSSFSIWPTSTAAAENAAQLLASRDSHRVVVESFSKPCNIMQYI